MNTTLRLMIRFGLIGCIATTAIGCGGGAPSTPRGESCDASQCMTPPDSSCQGEILTTYATTGTCDSSGGCIYEATATNCAETGGTCRAGACVTDDDPVVDPCDSVVCDAPPAATCDGNTAITFDSAGACLEDGTCAYPETQTDCGAEATCDNGVCTATDPCEGVTCDAPPASACEGSVVQDYINPGTCVAGECVYSAQAGVDCATAGQICQSGACVDIPVAAKIVINEIHYNPADAQGDDSDYEFIEIYNADSVPVDLAGYTFSAGVEHTFESLVVAPGAYVVVAANATTYGGQGYDVVAWTAGGLSNDGEALALQDAYGQAVDAVEFVDNGSWPSASDGRGYSLELGSSDGDNALPSSWRPSFVRNGTPGMPNSVAPTPTMYTLDEIRLEVPVDTYVAVSAIVTATFEDEFTLQDGPTANHGIWVDGQGVNVGDAVAIEGLVIDDFGLLKLVANNVTVTSADNMLPTPVVATTADVSSDAYEGMLVAVSGTCTNPDLGHGEWVIADATGELIIDDRGYIFDATADLTYDIVGVVDYAFESFRVLPRSATDITLTDPCSAITCDTPPSPSCTGNSVVNYDGNGVCSDGICSYASTTTDCGDMATCTGGTCVDNENPCVGVVCDSPPSGTCVEDGTAVTYDVEGVCVEGICEYAETVETCGASDYCVSGACQASPYISEYVEGSSFNKAVEIYNPGAGALVAGACQISVYSNGSMTASRLIALPEIPAGGTAVLCNAQYSADRIDGDCNATSTSLNHNGDDALVLSCVIGGGYLDVDVFGQIGTDPGNAWENADGTTTTRDRTLRRQCSVTTGDRDGSDAFDPAAEYEAFDRDVLDGLGAHCSEE